MAHIDQTPTLLPNLTSKEENEKAVGGEGRVWGDGEVKALGDLLPTPLVADGGTMENVSSTPLPRPTPARPSLVPLGSQTTPAAPQPKKFSTVNITKRFLEKNSSASGSASNSTSLTIKSGAPLARPPTQPASSHSKLVTTKLTAAPAISTSTAGWSRPSSVAPPPATNSPSNDPLPSITSTTAATSVPQLPHAGKVIQPQPRAAVAQPGTSQRETAVGTKPVWGNVKLSTATALRPDVKPNDFPTAAEVAKVAARKPPIVDQAKPAVDAAANQARLEEADTFRGVHLDPNAHHWDEMEEDNDDFLGGVIEFGDGRQYKIEANEDPPLQPSLGSKSQPGVIAPVSKEERFVDDFDRSWPKSRSSPASSSRDFTPAPLSHGSGSPQVSPVALQSAHSPQDSSRVLFNERSNRLEPYSHSHRPGQGQYPSKRTSVQESSTPLIDLRNRDFGAPTNVQVLQKSGGEYESRARRYSGSGSGSGPSHAFSNDRPRDRDQPSRRDGPSPLTRDGISPHPDYMGRGRDFNAERGRRTSMAPPPVPQHAIRRSSQEGGRQLPPHLAQSSPEAPLHQLSSRDSRLPLTEPQPPTPGSSQPHPSYSPAVSTASIGLVSPAATAAITLPHLTAPELDEARKDVMQSAAARAKQRRQQEEAEREAQKERARRKAAELEEKMKAEAEKAKQKESHDAPTTAQVSIGEDVVIAVIDEAVKSVTASKSPTSESSRLIPSRASVATPTSPLLSPATQTSSWRVKVNPQPLPSPSSTLRQIQPRPPAPSFHPPPRSALEESIADGANEDLEVVDFSDMGKFVGIPEAKKESSETEFNLSAAAVQRTSRAVASDFFEDKLTSTIAPAPTKTDFGTWRQKVSQDVLEVTPENKASLKSEVENDSPQKKVLSPRDLSTPPKEPLPDIAVSVEAIADAVVKDSLPPHLVSQRTPRNQGFYKEATMSALDDAMSRIKGAIVDIHSSDVSKDTTAPESEHLQGRSLQLTPQKSAAPKERWIPPALRLRNKFDFTDEPREVFDVTGSEPPRSPVPACNAYTVQISSISRAVEFIHKRQLHAFFRPIFQTQWDILSFDPPVEGMNRRDLSLNDVLFRKPPGGHKGKPRYRVMLPRHGTSTNRPRVQMPSASLLKSNGVGAFGRPTVADGASSWRNPAPSPKVDSINEESPSVALDTMSRSPPPELPQSNIASMPKSNESSPSKSEPSASLRSRSQPKMPAGSAVAFYRDSRIDAVEPEPKPLVNFTVTSELEESESSDVADAQTTSPVPFALITRDSKSNPCNSTINGVKRSSPLGRSKDDSLIMSKTNSRSSDDSTEGILITPPNHHAASAWSRSSLSVSVKDSPARGPDPEHLKAVWSQTSNKASMHAVNSLEGIADDLTALPFTLQDVKSEDGETPPPSIPQPPSRMSLHDVTRAFQQVPASSSSNAAPRTPISPPSTNAPVARPSFSYSPLPPNGMRPAYSYASPMMSHSPAPAVMYPHAMASSPVSSRMPINGHTPLYSQPIWMPMAVPAHQNQGGMMRPVASPYPAQLMPYPSPSTPTLYAPHPPPPNMINQPQQQNGAQVNRGRNMALMSPVMPHAGPSMYAGSPVLMHASGISGPQNHGYVPVPTARGQPRTDNGQMAPHQHPPNQHQSSIAYNPAPPSFARPTW